MLAMTKGKNIRFLGNQTGFTLVELLVVISVIGILSSFAVVSLNVARIKARNALRKGDMAQMRTALNVYYDIYERYPVCDLTWDDTLIDYGADYQCYNIELQNGLAGGARPLVNEMPHDPKNSVNLTVADEAENGHDSYIYKYVSDTEGSEYIMTYRLEGDTEDKIFHGR